MSYVLRGMRARQARCVQQPPQESTHADGTPQPVKYLFPGLQQGGNRSKSFALARQSTERREWIGMLVTKKCKE